ncbi:MAG: S9 family peptidase, partial [Planctomycetota bacterium]
MASDINIVDIESGEIKKLQPAAGFWTSPRVSPNGKLIAYTGNQAKEVNYPAQELRVINIDGSGDKVLIADLPDGAGAIEWASDGRGLYYTMNANGSTDVYFISLAGGEPRAVTSGVHRLSGLDIRGSHAAAVISAPKTTPNLVRVDLTNGGVNQLTDLNADILHDVDLGDIEEINYKSPDGTDVQGWLIKPPNFDVSKKYPLVLAIHGGPHAMYGVNFQFRFQEFAAKGYVVLYTNPRGSTGYGAEFANAIDNAYPGRADYEDLIAGVDATLKKGFIDEKRMYATGCSGGGVLTSWIVTQTDRFAAAAALCPVINWISFSGQADIGRWSFARFRPFYWEDPTNWLEHSPIMHVQNVKTPTLLMTGDKDLRTPLAQAE